jgi:hypothetical protein
VSIPHPFSHSFILTGTAITFSHTTSIDLRTRVMSQMAASVLTASLASKMNTGTTYIQLVIGKLRCSVCQLASARMIPLAIGSGQLLVESRSLNSKEMSKKTEQSERSNAMHFEKGIRLMPRKMVSCRVGTLASTYRSRFVNALLKMCSLSILIHLSVLAKQVRHIVDIIRCNINRCHISSVSNTKNCNF